MKVLTSRQHRLLRFLLKQQEYATLLTLAEQFEVSKKTIQRDLNIINDYLVNSNIRVDKKSGAGILLVAENTADLMQLEQQINNENDDADSVLGHARRIKIASWLLSETPRETSINKLSERHFISNASIVNDLKIIEDWITPLGLQLIRSQSGTRIKGNENDVRQAMAALINGLMNHQDPGTVNHSRLDPGSYKALVQYFGEKDVNFVQVLLQEMEQALAYPLGEPYYINIFTHILIMMHRRTRGNLLGSPKPVSRQHLEDPIFMIAGEMVAKIEQYITLSLPEDEVWFIYQYIISSGVLVAENHSDHAWHTELLSDEARDITLNLLEIFSNLISIDLSQDKQLYDGLVVHIRPLINRLYYQINIRNPLLDDIKNELADVYHLTRIAVEKVFTHCPQQTVSDDEVGYLAVHFQAAVERQITHKRVLLVCSTGIGTSHLLRSRILRAFPDWEIVATVPSDQLPSVTQQMTPDLIISTVHVPEIETPVVYVTAFLNDTDLQRITEKLITEKLHQARDAYTATQS
ncbi:BglG family transcription antiterminator [Celerinatantimonas diazotrophica]|uniref:BglG family transcriptional antiterminator n=1 Tax=Celerinatantimonas diazotrophica TaxID=412034 RepID=A0A4R1J9Z9_9GAMM|nr:PRD domain-containing protein [Celerinatantimonas diazotrophica]TCK47350.1 BglG family transcriptional antiterminator [Celerinatantimonas diazotrophica]CAG9295034.1 Transcriptional regulator ManR [Celerinatantimonas diazotrophica]